MRKLTIEIIAMQPEVDWIWEAHKTGEHSNGIRVISIASGHTSCQNLVDGICDLSGDNPKDPKF